MELDQFRNVDLVIDRASDSFVQRQFVSQGDYKGRSLTVQVTNNGSVGEIAGLTLNLQWHNKSSGLSDLSAFTVIDKSNSIFRIEYPEHMMTPGEVVASIQVLQNGKSTFLKTFTLTVQQLAGQAVGIAQQAEFSALVAVLADSNKFRTDIDALDTNKADKTSLSTTNQKVDSLAAGKVDKNGAGQVTWGMIAQDARENITNQPAVVGKNSVSTDNIVDSSVNTNKVTPLVQSGYFIPNDWRAKVNFDTNSGVLTTPSGQFFFANKPYVTASGTQDKSNLLTNQTYLFLIFVRSSSTFDLLSRADYIALTDQNVVFCGFFKIDTLAGNVRIPFSLNGQKIRNERITDGEIINSNLSGISKPGFYLPSNLNRTLYLDTTLKILTAGAGDVFQGVTRYNIANHSSDVTEAFETGMSKKLTLLLDIATKTFTVKSITMYNAMNENYVNFGVFDLATGLGNLTVPLVVDGVAVKNGDLYQNRMLSTTVDPVNIDFISKKIIIPRFTRVIDGSTNVQPSLFSLNMLSGEQVVYFRHSTRAISVVPLGDPALTGDITFLLYLNADTGSVQTPYEYTINGFLSSSVDGVPNYAIARVDDIVDEISETKNKKMLTFGLISDTHGDSRHLNSLVYSSKFGVCDFYVHAGDINLTESDKKKVRNYYNQCQLALEKIKVPVYVAQGNHDQSGTGGNDVGTLPKSEFANRFILSQKQNTNVVFPDDETLGYYYVDDDKHKVRLVVVNSCSEASGNSKRWGIDMQQLKWIAENALDLTQKQNSEQEWQVLVISHHNLSAALSVDATFAKNGDILLGILKAFKEGSIYTNATLGIDVDYAKTHILIATLCGHVHADNLYIDEELGFYQISTTCSQTIAQKTSATTGEILERTLGTITEDAWDIFCIDLENRHAEIKRFGAGENRQFDY